MILLITVYYFAKIDISYCHYTLLLVPIPTCIDSNITTYVTMNCVERWLSLIIKETVVNIQALSYSWSLWAVVQIPLMVWSHFISHIIRAFVTQYLIKRYKLYVRRLQKEYTRSPLLCSHQCMDCNMRHR